MGHLVYRYADQIFSIGTELLQVIKGHPQRRPLIVGIADVLPKLVAYKLLEPARALPEPVRIVCREDRPEKLIAELAVHNLDIILSDAPMSPGIRVKAFSHLLGECGMSFIATPKLAAKYKRGFPKSLDGAPLLVPSEETASRSALEQWFLSHEIKPIIVGEFADSALMKIFGEAGDGIFPAPSALDGQLRKQGGLEIIGRIQEIRERFYVISVERRLTHPAAIAISEGARQKLFSS
jgi:LysR family transcriptional regulator, transcriptional activator of nhaA